MRKTVLFYRDYRAFSGGHLKVWDYFQHTLQSVLYEPKIHFSKKSLWDKTNPWRDAKIRATGKWKPEEASVLFVAGMDWLSLSRGMWYDSKVPIINLVQHVRHADPADPRYQFLRNRAVRICVSEEVGHALRTTGIVNGPLFVIPNCIDTAKISSSPGQRERVVDVLIVGIKQRDMALRLRDEIQRPGLKIMTLVEQVAREDFLNSLVSARTAVFLPHETEGFYLPALEGMAAGAVVVCPDCVGNRSYCVDGENCWMPAHDFSQILSTTKHAMLKSDDDRDLMVESAMETSSCHDLSVERTKFLEILHNIEGIW